MSVNKNAQIRYNIIDECLRNPGKKYFWEDLANACGKAIAEYNGIDRTSVSRRTILNDIKYMKSEAGFQAPIIGMADGRKKYYRYEDMTFSIRNQPLNTQEVAQLKTAIEFLSRLSGVEEFDWIQDLLPKLQISVDEKVNHSIINYEANIDLKNRDFLGQLFNHIRVKNVLKITYQPFIVPNPIIHIFHPHHLKQYNTRWFLFGLSNEFYDKGRHPVNLALDRIKSIEIINDKFIENEAINYSEYFDDIIGVTKYRGKELVSIKLRIHPKLRDYIETKPLHQSQKKLKKEANSDFYTTTIKVIPNYELHKTLLSHGDRIEVLSPKEIRDDLAEKVLSMFKIYHE